MLTRQVVEEFQEIYRRRYGVSLSETDALEIASGLLNLYRTVYAEPNMKRDENDRTERTDQKQ